MFRSLILAAALALPVAAPLATPAEASGSISLNLTPRNADEAALLRLGLGLYALRQDIRTNGHVTQSGWNNAAGIGQSGPGNQGIIHQEGCNHTGTINQSGGYNSHGLFQFGCNTSGHVTQTGGQTGITVQYGW